MDEINYQPKNTEYFNKLLLFYDKLILICEELYIKPILTGSLAYAFYSNDNNIDINDIDLLVPEKELINITKGNQNNYKFELTTYNSLNMFLDNIKISFDSLEHYYTNLKMEFNKVKINQRDFLIIKINELVEIYKRGITSIDVKRTEYLYKYNILKKLIKDNQ